MFAAPTRDQIEELYKRNLRKSSYASSDDSDDKDIYIQIKPSENRLDRGIRNSNG